MKFLFGLLLPLVILSSGCTDNYTEGHDAGYAAGAANTKLQMQDEFGRKVAQIERASRSYSAHSYSSVYSTAVCGGAGLNLNAKYYSGGEAGCVKVHSDGRMEKY